MHVYTCNYIHWTCTYENHWLLWVYPLAIHYHCTFYVYIVEAAIMYTLVISQQVPSCGAIVTTQLKICTPKFTLSSRNIPVFKAFFIQFVSSGHVGIREYRLPLINNLRCALVRCAGSALRLYTVLCTAVR